MPQHLTANDKLTRKLNTIGIQNWSTLIEYIQNLPYGRTSNRTDLSLVIREQKGTCSSKHALLKHVADLNNIKGIKLVIGLYKMSEENTPGIGTHLSDNGLSYIPEAHCYLKVNGIQTDYTSADSTFQKIQNDLLEELEINPSQISQFKVDYHQEYIKSWLYQNKVPQSFEELWTIRENCIQHLSTHSSNP